MSKTSICKGCGKEIVWMMTPGKKWMPCDTYGPYNSKSGGTVVTKNGKVVQAEDIKEQVMGYRPHWGNCSMAKAFKK